MTTRDVTIEIKQGSDVSPVAKCVQVASQFTSKIYVEYETKKVNAKSIMGMMSLSLAEGEELTVVTEGDDEKKAAEGIKTFFTKVKE